ncbi:MAG TPA: lytic transglycosylase domain-containing protein [Anaerolineae bacterium]|nr:lytic transglycosylase domain-containing protein [Anaerolineae bacterium]
MPPLTYYPEQSDDEFIHDEAVDGYESGYSMTEIETPFSATVYDTYVEQPVWHNPHDILQKRMAIILGVVLFLVVTFALFWSQTDIDFGGDFLAGLTGQEVSEPEPQVVRGRLSPVFAPTVLYWEDLIIRWSTEMGIDPHMAATIMQIESCGDPLAISRAGAQGLFQVMPFHFGAGEDMLDPDTNARRGLNYFKERLEQSRGNVGLAFAGYNGGHGAVDSRWDDWPAETQRYYVWSTGIYDDIQAGLEVSPTMQEWLNAGGASLCRQASTRLGLATVQ